MIDKRRGCKFIKLSKWRKLTVVFRCRSECIGVIRFAQYHFQNPPVDLDSSAKSKIGQPLQVPKNSAAIWTASLMLLLVSHHSVCCRLASSYQVPLHSGNTISQASARNQQSLVGGPLVHLNFAASQVTALFADEEEDGADTEEEEEFFNQMPYEQTASTSDNIFALDDEDDPGSEVQVSDSDFKDFDDHEALQTEKFYEPMKEIKSKGSRLHPTLKRSPSQAAASNWSQKYQMAASHTNGARLPRPEVGCAAALARGDCLTYQMIDWAVRRARRELDFREPADMDSTEPSEASIGAVGELVETTGRLLVSRLGLSADVLDSELGQVDMSRTELWRSCPLIFRQQPTCPLTLTRYRSFTGRCNNLILPQLGSSNQPFFRMLDLEYSDMIGLPRRSPTSGNELPPVRLVALNLHPDLENPNDQLSGLFMSWGQLINHDLAMASGARDETGHTSACCPASTARQRAMWTQLGPMAREVCLPIEMGPDDPVYGQYNVHCQDFKRSISGLRIGCSLGSRTQINTITSFVDASFVYGSQSSTMNSLRTNRRGLMATWNYFERQGLKPLLPAQVEQPDLECIGRSEGRYCFRSGDLRTNQQVPLAALHTIHTRQHNRLARALSQLNPHWSDELVYQEARHIHVAMIQHILLNEYLPALLGERTCAKYNLAEAPPGTYWDHYEPQVIPSISQEFAAAAFRFGHSMISGEVYRFSANHQPVQMYQLRRLFRQPWPLFEPYALDEFLLGQVDAPAQSLDPFITLEVSGHLLETPERPFGFDLTSINLQRGRDQGLAGYTAARHWCGLRKASSFSELDLYMSKSSRTAMESLYESVDDIDLFTGGISEFPLEGAQVGPTFACIIGRQFHALRAGDRFWFESSSGPQAFSPEQLDSIKQVSLARLLCANSDHIITIQGRALHLAHPVLNPRQLCHALPDLDIRLWLDTTRPSNLEE